MRLRAASATDVGRVRTNNEDQLLVTDTLFAVADGMGGHVGGEVAASIAVEALKVAFQRDPTADGLAEGVRIANAHTFLLQNGGMKDLDAAQIEFKRAADPHLLMNPGKVAGLDDLPGGLSGTALEAAQLPASGWAY